MKSTDFPGKPQSNAVHLDERFSQPLRVLFAVVIANYLAQIPYALHLYGLRVNPNGVLLLGLTLVWFLSGFLLLRRGSSAGHWLLLSFLAAQVIFYFRNEILLIPEGYGLFFHLVNIKDPVVWAVELIGIVNGFVAAYFLYYLVRNRGKMKA